MSAFVAQASKRIRSEGEPDPPASRREDGTDPITRPISTDKCDQPFEGHIRRQYLYIRYHNVCNAREIERIDFVFAPNMLAAVRQYFSRNRTLQKCPANDNAPSRQDDRPSPS